MDNANNTTKEYIRLEEDNARRCKKVYNWESITYGKIWYDDDIHDLRSIEIKFLTIVFNDELTSKKALSYEPTTESARQISDKGDLSAYWTGISSEGDFLGIPLSYTLIQDTMLRLCHRFIACSIAGRSQAPKKVTVTDLFYLRGMDIGSVNIPYLFEKICFREKAGGHDI
nr:hypothetical protein [Tanacetum cinerariifolium]